MPTGQLPARCYDSVDSAAVPSPGPGGPLLRSDQHPFLFVLWEVADL